MPGPPSRSNCGNEGLFCDRRDSHCLLSKSLGNTYRRRRHGVRFVANIGGRSLMKERYVITLGDTTASASPGPTATCVNFRSSSSLSAGPFLFNPFLPYLVEIGINYVFYLERLLDSPPGDGCYVFLLFYHSQAAALVIDDFLAIAWFVPKRRASTLWLRACASDHKTHSTLTRTFHDGRSSQATAR